jgi:arylesterase / paraoxonase
MNGGGTIVRVILIGAALLVAVLVGYGVFLFAVTGEFRSVETHHPGACRVVDGAPGSEDITIHPNGRVAYVSSDDRRSAMAGTPVPGAIYRYDLTDPDAQPVNLTPEAGSDFRPHGIHLHIGADGREVLFVVNHPGAGSRANGADGPPHTIEIFDIEEGMLVHRETIAGDAVISPNDVVGVGPRQFYFTNDHGTRPGFLRQLEDYLRLPWSGVVYFDGARFHDVAGGLTYANGINVSPDGRRMFVSEVSRGTVREYDRDPATGALTHRRTLRLRFGVDNIEIGPDGELWIAGHPKLLTFVRHAGDASVRAPSQAVRVVLGDVDHEVESIFVDDGSLISGSSVAAYRDGRLLIGSVFEPHFVDCRLDL